MEKPPKSNQIGFLLERKFGPAARPSPTSQHSTTTTVRSMQIAEYKSELLKLSPERFEELYATESEMYQAEWVAKAAKEEAQRFFNYANADVAHWSKAPYWTLDEAIALSFGKAPEWVTWEKIKPLVAVSAFASRYSRRRDLALRAVAIEQLYEPVLPGFFIAWAKRMDEPVVPELEAAVAARGQIVDWKSLYEEAAKSIDRMMELRDAAQRRYGDAISLLDQSKAESLEVLRLKDEEISRLHTQLEGFKSKIGAIENAGGSSHQREVRTRERDSLLKLIIGMAVAGYKYDPKAGRSDKITEIANDLAELGISLDVDTVRKWLREAAELLPPKTE
jgi:hypothetical protein